MFCQHADVFCQACEISLVLSLVLRYWKGNFENGIVGKRFWIYRFHYPKSNHIPHGGNCPSWWIKKTLEILSLNYDIWKIGQKFPRACSTCSDQMLKGPDGTISLIFLEGKLLTPHCGNSKDWGYHLNGHNLCWLCWLSFVLIINWRVVLCISNSGPARKGFVFVFLPSFKFFAQNFRAYL